ncbi:uncharacterized protein LOC1269519 isoform X22 [Anopheles gambiae]|uniref:uncharacterized protein LOC1269519 isoform X22 n=1 Tax=Anopheles gambiae TaxID=7165 RepID=UPI002AC8FD51|nr:uncharacterized protein LOC1269519 isoform X22 [Anopheles gambiae]
MSKYAWVTLATNDSYSLGALVVAHSLKRVHTEHQTAVLITPGVSESMKTKLRAVFNVVEEVNLLDSKDEANLALLKRPELGVTFTKLHCWRLTQFEKCVFLDADTLVLRNCDELFEREELSAAPDIGWPDCFNSGVYVYTPNMETFSSLVQYAVTHGSFDGGDQGLLNSYFSDWAHKDIQKHLPFIYNTSSVATYSYLPAFKQFGQNTKILHFIGVAKPWLQNFNSETRKVYVPSECQHLANFLQYWWDIFAEDVHSRLSPDMSGIAGALAQLHLGEAKSKEQEAYEEHMRRQCWETGNIDYMGRDSFDNIWKRIQQTINTGSCMEESSEASVAQTTAPGTTQRASRRPSRSRSATPKRDPKDRSPTPQPEEKISVDKKEAQVVPPPVIAEEDDVAVSLSTMDCSSFAIRLQTSRLPPPIQYDPTTNTTTLTKKVFAGYQQIITTKSPEGKTRTHTKLVYDPSVEDDETKEEANVPLTTPTVASNQDVVDGTVMQKATVNTPPVSSKQKITTAAAEGGMKEMSSTKTAMQASNITPGIKKDANVSQSPMPKSASNPTAPSSAQQPQQQVAQESLAASSSKAEASNTQNTLNTRTFLNNQKDESALTLPLLEKTSTPASQSSPSTKSSTETKPNHTAVEGSKVGSPPVPPRRKRESRTAKIAKAKKSKIYQLLLSCISCTKKKR